jgi:hypothetical protein
LLTLEYRESKTFSGVIGAENAGEAEGLKALIAFRNAKKDPIPYIKGGSPTALDLKIARLSLFVPRK